MMQKNGATIIEDDEVVSVERFKNHWQVLSKKNRVISSKILINASGPWINHVLENIIKVKVKKIRLIKGSHLITKKIFNEKCALTSK